MLNYIAFRADIAHKVLTVSTSLIKESPIGLDYLADKMLENNIINEAEKGRVSDRMNGRTANERMDELLAFLKATVKLDGTVFGWFIKVLRDKDTVSSKAVAKQLEDKYTELSRQIL